MERRSFLGLVGLGSVGLVLAPDRTLWMPLDVAVPPFIRPFETIEDIARRAFVILERQLRLAPLGRLIGSRQISHPSTFSILMGYPDDGIVTNEAYLEPAMSAIAHEVEHKGLRQFGVLDVPRGIEARDVAVISSERSGLSLRLMKYETDGRPGLCVDILGGGRPA